MKSSKLVSVAAAVGMAFSVGQAHAAFSFTFLNDSHTVTYDETHEGVDLDATVMYTLTGWTTNTATFSITATNNTVDQAGQNRLIAFGVEVIDPNPILVSDNTTDWGTTVQDTFPGFQQVDFCAWDGSNCSGGGNEGLDEGGDAVTFSATFTFSGTPFTDEAVNVTFSEDFTIKFQSVGSNEISVEFPGTGNGGGTPQLPEPGSLALLGLGLLGIGLVRRYTRV